MLLVLATKLNLIKLMQTTSTIEKQQQLQKVLPCWILLPPKYLIFLSSVLKKNLLLNGDVLDLISQCHSFPFFSFALLLCRGQLPTVILSCHLAKAFRQNQIILSNAEFFRLLFHVCLCQILSCQWFHKRKLPNRGNLRASQWACLFMSDRKIKKLHHATKKKNLQIAAFLPQCQHKANAERPAHFQKLFATGWKTYTK